jgi:hypothetical protein
MKNGTLSTSLDAPLYKLLEQPTTKLRHPFSWQRAFRGAAIGAAALASVLAAPFSRALFLTTYQANVRAEHQQAMNQLAGDVAKGWRPMPTGPAGNEIRSNWRYIAGNVLNKTVSDLNKTASTPSVTPHQWDAQRTAYGKAGTIGQRMETPAPRATLVHHMTETEYQRRMAAHELTAGDVNRHNRGE